MEACPCGRPRPYAACCELLHQGKQRAATAEDLMRSRYAAYVLGKVPYLIETWHPSKRAALDAKAIARSARQTRWRGLTILDTEGGSLFDATGVVEFEAAYEGGVMRERSRFERVDGAWRYLDGEVSERT